MSSTVPASSRTVCSARYSAKITKPSTTAMSTYVVKRCELRDGGLIVYQSNGDQAGAQGEDEARDQREAGRSNRNRWLREDKMKDCSHDDRPKAEEDQIHPRAPLCSGAHLLENSGNAVQQRWQESSDYDTFQLR